jgi:hypothetical protein
VLEALYLERKRAPTSLEEVFWTLATQFSKILSTRVRVPSRDTTVGPHVSFFFIFIAFDLICASVLDPRISCEAFREDYTDNEELLADLGASKLNLRSHFEDNYAAATPVLPPPTQSQPELRSPPKVDFTPRYKKKGISRNDLQRTS